MINKKFLSKLILIALLCTIFLAQSTHAFAGHRTSRRRRSHKRYVIPASNFLSIMIGDSLFYYYSSTSYKKGRFGYYITTVPQGCNTTSRRYIIAPSSSYCHH